jgi:hypothetical protein
VGGSGGEHAQPARKKNPAAQARRVAAELAGLAP